jgi:hypothetical protein
MPGLCYLRRKCKGPPGSGPSVRHSVSDRVMYFRGNTERLAGGISGLLNKLAGVS